MNGLQQRFWDKVIKRSTGKRCWQWMAATDQKGYGRISVNHRPHLAHRLSWRFANGDIPAGLCVLHRCDNPACVRPSHLFLGTAQDNNADMNEKGRGAKGNQYPQSKLTPDAVRKIRADTRMQKDIAEEFGVHPSLISYVKNGKVWSYVT